MLPLIGQQRVDLEDDPRTERAVEDAQAVLSRFPETFGPALEGAMRAKLGLALEQGRRCQRWPTGCSRSCTAATPISR